MRVHSRRKSLPPVPSADERYAGSSCLLVPSGHGTIVLSTPVSGHAALHAHVCGTLSGAWDSAPCFCVRAQEEAADTEFSFLPWSYMDIQPFSAPTRGDDAHCGTGKGHTYRAGLQPIVAGLDRCHAKRSTTITVRRRDLRRGNCMVPEQQGIQAHHRDAHRHGLPIVLSSLFAVDAGIVQAQIQVGAPKSGFKTEKYTLRRDISDLPQRLDA